MGRRRPLAALVIAAASLGASAPDGLREAQWIAPEARFEQLSTVAVPCISDFENNPLPGAVAFEDPLLLGGQAARAGLSCASCHRGGRGNPAFVFPGISGAPGTADVTASLLSPFRGDGIFNPKPIPDLTHGPRTVKPEDLQQFIRNLIVEEFDGPEPPPLLLASLTAYVRALDPAACAAARPKDALYDLARYAMALQQAMAAIDDTDRGRAIAMVRAARSRLGTIAERYAGLAAANAALDEAGAALGQSQDALWNLEELEPVRARLAARHSEIAMWSQPLLEAEAASLYNPERLKTALNAERP